MDANKQRNVSLDVVRGIAIILVLIRHIPGEPASGPLRALFELGWTGVDLFFVLSGYLISTLLYRELDSSGTIRLKRFWLRRGLKIWPAYFFCYGTMILVAVALEINAGNSRGAVIRVLASAPNLIFIQNYTGYWWPHSWSLAIEEHFYLLLPLLLLLFRKSLASKLPAILISICVSVLLIRTTVYLAGWHRWQTFYYPTHMRVDALAFGVLIGYFHYYRRDSFYAIARFWPILLALTPLVGIAIIWPLEYSAFAVTAGFTVLYLAYGATVWIAAAYPSAGSSFWLVRLLAACGVYSYSIYLVHSALSLAPIFSSESPTPNSWLVRVSFWMLSISGGVCLSHLIERPFLRWRHTLYPANGPSQKILASSGVLAPADTSR
jgi:peptidoglycan/LPS O-acetylase OafA/YrhL